MKTGDRIGSLPLSCGEDYPNRRKFYPGRVIYIHPQRRYFVAELELPGGHHVRETYYFNAPASGTAKPKSKGKKKG